MVNFTIMKPDNFIRALAGTLVLASVTLAHFVSQWWLLLACFVGLNLIQSAFTGLCPAVWAARRLGCVHDASAKLCCAARKGSAAAGSSHPHS